MIRQIEIEVLQQMPIERVRRGRRAGWRILWRTGIEQDAVGDCGIAGQHGKIGRGRDRHNLHDRAGRTFA